MTPTPETLRELRKAMLDVAREARPTWTDAELRQRSFFPEWADTLETAAGTWEETEQRAQMNEAAMDNLARKLTATEELLAEAGKPCIWMTQSDGNGDYWETACGQSICFEVEGPAENEYDYCPGCGHPLMLVPHIGEMDIEDCAALAQTEEPTIYATTVNDDEGVSLGDEP